VIGSGVWQIYRGGGEIGANLSNQVKMTVKNEKGAK